MSATRLYVVVLSIMLSSSILARAQDTSATPTARQLAMEGIRLMDEGKYKESRELLNRALALEPDDEGILYELGFSYYLEQDFKRSLEICVPLLDRRRPGLMTFEIVGNSYDYLGNTEKAIDAYTRGLKFYPASGRLHLELGILYSRKGDAVKGLEYFEKGIEVEPEFPSNYYHAARFYCATTEAVWGMIYGEIFLNLERSTARTKEISALLYNTYKERILVEGDTSMHVSFSKNSIVDVSSPSSKQAERRLPYGVFVYELTLMKTITDIKPVTMDRLSEIRMRFIDNYYASGFDSLYTNPLFDYQYKLKRRGFMEAYDHWVLMSGNDKEFEAWASSHETAWNEFMAWFKEHPLTVSTKNAFTRAGTEGK